MIYECFPSHPWSLVLLIILAFSTHVGDTGDLDEDDDDDDDDDSHFGPSAEVNSENIIPGKCLP